MSLTDLLALKWLKRGRDRDKSEPGKVVMVDSGLVRSTGTKRPEMRQSGYRN